MYQAPNYLDILEKSYPDLRFRCFGEITYQNIEIISGGSKPDQVTLDAELLTEKRLRVWYEIQEERTRRQAGGVFIQSENKWFHSDQTSRIQQLGLVMMGNNMPQNISWKTMDNSFTTMTPALALSIFNAAATLDMTAFAVAEQHRSYVNQSTTPETYNYSGFWPAIYEE